MIRNSRPALDVDDAQAIALRALSFLIADPNRLSRFMSLTGMGPSDFRQVAESQSQLASTLEYMLADESLLLAFCQEARVDPEMMGPALALLSKAAE